MATSEKRVAANRQNAKKSTGPRTLDGKERARLNAVTHGLTAQTAVLPGEDPGELEALSKSLMRQLKPRGVVQRIIAERVVSLAWKLRRVARAEEAVAREMDEAALAMWKHEREVNLANDRYIFPERDRPKARDGATLLAASWEHNKRECRDDRLLRLSEYELKLDGALRAAVRELLKLQKEADAFEDPVEEPEEIAAGENEAKGEPVAEPPDRPAPEEPEQAPESKISNLNPETSGPNPGTTDSEHPPVETNPTPPPAPVAEAPGVTGLAAESSAPAPGTSASPPPGPRR
jgi:hypothetical protein